MEEGDFFGETETIITKCFSMALFAMHFQCSLRFLPRFAACTTLVVSACGYVTMVSVVVLSTCCDRMTPLNSWQPRSYFYLMNDYNIYQNMY